MPEGGRSRDRTATAGFTLLELLIVFAVLAVLASMGIPLYQTALDNARIQKAKSELRTLATEIDTFRAKNNLLPLTLADIGRSGRLDPWGNPYCYLNFSTGTGDGLDWAVRQGLVDPGAVATDGSTPISPGRRDAFVREIQGLPTAPLPASPDPTVDTTAVKRRDRFLFPLNTDYDLFSLGKNRVTRVSLGDPASLDDVIRANDGGYFGLAAKY